MSMREPAFLVLAALAGHRAHGWAVLQEVERISDGRVRLQVGSLYAVLERLEADGLIAADGEEEHNGRVRRYFVLTDEGEKALETEADVAAANAEIARRRIATRRLGRPAANS